METDDAKREVVAALKRVASVDVLPKPRRFTKAQMKDLLEAYDDLQRQERADQARAVAEFDKRLLKAVPAIENGLKDLVDLLPHLPRNTGEWPSGWQHWPKCVLGWIGQHDAHRTRRALSADEIATMTLLLSVLAGLDDKEQRLVWGRIAGKLSFGVLGRWIKRSDEDARVAYHAALLGLAEALSKRATAS